MLASGRRYWQKAGFVAENDADLGVPGDAEDKEKQPETASSQINVLAQYIKDFSFENPNAPQILNAASKTSANQRPQIDVTVNVNARGMGQDIYEVELQIQATSKSQDKTQFIVELAYAGMFRIQNLPRQQLEPFLLIECPHILFPFVRRIIADTTRDGGYPPLLMDPIDFTLLYQKHMEERATALPEGAGGSSAKPN